MTLRERQSFFAEFLEEVKMEEDYQHQKLGSFYPTVVRMW